MLRSNLCDFADSYILAKGTITITGAGDNTDASQADERDKGVTFKNYAPFTKCMSRINNTNIDNAQDNDIVMPMYNLIELVIIILRHLEVYGNTTKMIQMTIYQILNHLNLK